MSHLRAFEYVEASSIDEAIQALTLGEDPRLIAGGTVVVPTMKLKLIRPDVLVSIQQIPGIAAIELAGDRLRVGAMATHQSVARSEAVRALAPPLAHACSSVASPVIRSMGTLGGNLCYGETGSDPAPVLLSLRAQLHARGPDGDRAIAIEDFFVGLYETALAPAEILTAIEVPELPSDARWSYMKWSPRAHEDKPLVGLAIILHLEDGVCRDARLAVGGVAERPTPLPQAAATLIGNEVSPELVDAAADVAASEVDPIQDFQASASYRRDMLRLWTRRRLLALMGVKA